MKKEDSFDIGEKLCKHSYVVVPPRASGLQLIPTAKRPHPIETMNLQINGCPSLLSYSSFHGKNPSVVSLCIETEHCQRALCNQ